MTSLMLRQYVTYVIHYHDQHKADPLLTVTQSMGPYPGSGYPALSCL